MCRIAHKSGTFSEVGCRMRNTKREGSDRRGMDGCNGRWEDGLIGGCKRGGEGSDESDDLGCCQWRSFRLSRQHGLTQAGKCLFGQSKSSVDHLSKGIMRKFLESSSVFRKSGPYHCRRCVGKREEGYRSGREEALKSGSVGVKRIGVVIESSNHSVGIVTMTVRFNLREMPDWGVWAICSHYQGPPDPFISDPQANPTTTFAKTHLPYSGIFTNIDDAFTRFFDTPKESIL